MPRARNIKPAFFQNDRLGDVPPLARLLFIGLWTLADFRGIVEVRVRRIRVQLLPYDDANDDDVSAFLNVLERSGFIESYSVAGQTYIKVVNWTVHQNPHINEKKMGSRLPDIDQRDDADTQKTRRISGLAKELQKDGTGLEHDGSAPADSLFLIPDSLIPLPDPQPLAQPPSTLPASRQTAPPGKKRVRPEALTTPVWQAYADAYRQRYQVDPVRNATVNGRLANLVARLGADAAAVAAFYLTHDAAFYVRSGHDVGALLRDCESLRTQWATGARMTAHKANATDRASTTLDAFAQMIEEANAV